MQIRITANFDRNLEQIRRFLEELDARQAFEQLLNQLFDVVIPNLERFPEMGRDFLARQPLSAEGLARHERLTKRLGQGELREYIFDDYLLLYAHRDQQVDLLSIRHHRQLSFDLKDHWS